MPNPIPETKDFKFTLSDVNDAEGTFEGYASVWDVVDGYGDIVKKGAFKRTIKNNKGKGWPMLWSHKYDEPLGIIYGEEDERGLRVKGQFNMSDPEALRIRSHMQMGSVTGLSIGYATVVEEFDKNTKTRLLKEIKLYEISPVVFPACEPAQVESVKTADGEDVNIEDSAQATPDTDSSPEEHLHLLVEFRDNVLGLKNLIEGVSR